MEDALQIAWKLVTAYGLKVVAALVILLLLDRRFFLTRRFPLALLIGSAPLLAYLYLPLALVSSVLLLDEELTFRKVAGVALVVGVSIALSTYRYRRTL